MGVDQVLQDQLAQLVSEEVGDNVAPLVKLESLDYLANQAHKVQGEEMDQRDLWENLANLDHKVFLDLLENQVLLDLLGLLDLLVKPKLFHKQSVEVKVCLDLQELTDPWVLLVLLENVELVELVLQREALECLESLEVLVGQEDQALLDKLVLLEPLEKMENLDENTARMISEKFVPQSYETACLNLLLDYQDLLEDLVVDIVDQLGPLVPEVQLEILESREKLDKEVSQDYQVCLELLGLLDPKENVVILVILVCQVLEVWDLQVELDLLGVLDPRVLVSLVHKETGELLEKQAKEDYLVDLDPLDPQVIVNSVMVLLLKQTDRLTKKALEHLEKDSYKQSCWNLIPCPNHNQYYLFCAQYKHVNPSIYLNIHAYYNYTYDEVIKHNPI